MFVVSGIGRDESFARSLIKTNTVYTVCNGTSLGHGDSQMRGCRFIRICVTVPSGGCWGLMDVTGAFYGV